LADGWIGSVGLRWWVDWLAGCGVLRVNVPFSLVKRGHHLDTLYTLFPNILILVHIDRLISFQVELLPHAQLARSAAKKFFGKGEKGEE
jgi:hypothetical protein